MVKEHYHAKIDPKYRNNWLFKKHSKGKTMGNNQLSWYGYFPV